LVRVLLKFNKDIVNQPITSKVIIEQKTPINVLAAHINQEGGSILVEIETEKAQTVIQALRQHKVIVDVQDLIEVDSEKCTDCGACFSICPVNAINQENDYSIQFEKEKCLGITCGLCIDSCPSRAVKLIG